MERIYGWHPSLPDARNLVHDFSGVAYPASFDLVATGFFPSIWDQTTIGSCVAHGVERAYGFDLAKQGGPKNFTGSRLFQYYNARAIEGTTSSDSGSSVADGIKALAKYGAPPETDWPYTVSKYTQKPPAKAYEDGLLRQALKYAQVPQDAASMKACIAAGTPIVIGFTVYDSFESDEVAATGKVPMPGAHESVLGGHCVVVVGYTPTTWHCANSWGVDWGQKGYFDFPTAYLTNPNLADDFWTVTQVESPDPAPTPPAPATDKVSRATVLNNIYKLRDTVLAL